MDSTNWKEFNIVDLFNINNGKRLTKEDWGDPIYPYIGSSAINNGITGMCDQYNYENAIVINYDGSVGYTFWHPYKFMMSDACKALIPKFDISENIALFLCVVLTNTFVGIYHYSNKLSTKKLQGETIYLPEKNGQPDWEYMESLINLIREEYGNIKLETF